MSTQELRQLLRQREAAFEAALAGSAASDVGRAAVLRAGVAGARRSAWGRVAAAAAAVVVIGGVAAWVIGGLGEEVPPITGPGVSETPSPAASADELQFGQPLPADGFFLEARQLTQAVWEQAAPGWSLTTWQPSRQAQGDAGQQVTDPGVLAVYLMTGEGERYEVAHFDMAPGEYVTSVFSWVPREFRAAVQTVTFGGDDYEQRAQWLDLRTGVLTPIDGLAGDEWVAGHNADGNVLLTAEEGIVVMSPQMEKLATFEGLGGVAPLSPDGTLLVADTGDDMDRPLAVTAYSSSTGEELWSADLTSVDDQPGAECELSGWAGPHQPALVCAAVEYDPSGGDFTIANTRFYAVAADGADLVGEHSEDLYFGAVAPAAGGLVAGASETEEGNDLTTEYFIDRAELALWPAPALHREWPRFSLAGDVEAVRWDSHADFSSYSATNTATGRAFDITPPLQADPEWWWTTRAGVLVVGALGEV